MGFDLYLADAGLVTFTLQPDDNYLVCHEDASGTTYTSQQVITMLQQISRNAGRLAHLIAANEKLTQEGASC